MLPHSTLADSLDSIENVTSHRLIWIRHMVQAQLFQKSNPDTHYAHAVFKFMREWAVKNHQNIAFLAQRQNATYLLGNMDISDCSNNKAEKSYCWSQWKVTNHDFSKLFIIPEAYLLHEIPGKDKLMDKKVDDDLLDKGSHLWEW